jgi:IclR family transcriptional regulator, acetate operon repressor
MKALLLNAFICVAAVHNCTSLWKNDKHVHLADNVIHLMRQGSWALHLADPAHGHDEHNTEGVLLKNNTHAVDGVRAVERALEILKAFSVNDPELSAAQLLQRVPLSRPTLYRLLQTLVKSGFVVSVGEPQKFRLGPAVGQLTHAWSSGLNISLLGQPIMQRVWETTEETVALFVPQGHMRLCIAELPSAQALSFKRGVGYQERIVLGASGQVILAHADVTIEAIERYAEGLPIEPLRFAQDLRQIRKRGYASSKNALIEGAVAIAAPFFNSHGQVAGSIAVFGPGVRLKDEKVRQFGAILVKEAAALSRVLGQA